MPWGGRVRAREATLDDDVIVQQAYRPPAVSQPEVEILMEEGHLERMNEMRRVEGSLTRSTMKRSVQGPNAAGGDMADPDRGFRRCG
jgi:hypothetical protein